MAETSQSAMRVIGLIFFTMVFAGAWANDRPNERMALKEMPKSTEILSKEDETASEVAPEVKAEEELVAIEVPAPIEIPRPVLEVLDPTAIDMTMTISIESEGLSIADVTIKQHVQELPLGITNGDYLMVDPQGGVGWIRIRGQQQKDTGETMLATTIGDEVVRYMRVSPIDAVEPVQKPVPVPRQYALEESESVVR
ncbi:hypothetical protein OAF98_00165 [Planctomicrobium sp.]|nr:hypothetical protein [Planctomicrobium sp.]MDA7527901.1 hypothetical protein [bacterium]MDB4439795.1 hypothetical protein [Planctomicrobium sp.]MDB4731212.1 hypothetical protein [bacterium]MDB4742870.1 hypothetical protein [Planctomicrobium sp.]